MKSTITRERLQELAAGQSGFNLRTATHEESQELARMALAAMDSEPVAEITEDLGRLFVKIHYPTTLRAGDKLYRHAQPAPVVPDELLNEIDDLLSVCRVYACRSRRSGSEHDIPRTEKAQEWLRSCRAAMLATAPQEVKP
ncbi:TPA: hypothetical protein NO485_005013 [Klebsiella pneumoniae]|nr:hypothetical protein [Klebsiella pneumoniae]HCI6686765.1 hypothetical protein [Klebsiella pneumoniae]